MQTYYRRRKKYGGLKLGQAKRMKELERENLRLRRFVAKLLLFSPPDPLHPILAHLPPCFPQDRCDPPIAVPPVLLVRASVWERLIDRNSQVVGFRIKSGDNQYFGAGRVKEAAPPDSRWSDGWECTL